MSQKRLDTIALHAGQENPDTATGARAIPIYQTTSLPYAWYETPNLHFLSISDFFDYCRRQNIRIKRTAFIDNRRMTRILPNLLAQTGLFLISK